MKIIVPTDFSPLSKVAVLYAANLSMTLKAKLVLFNVVFIERPSRALAGFTSDEILKKLINESENECIQLIEEVKRTVPGELKLEYEVASGQALSEAVNAFARQHSFDLIVIGTKGASGLKKVLLGSNAAAVISNSSIPVLTVPEFADFRGISEMVYASDMNDLFAEFTILLPLAKIFNTTIQVVHVYQSGSEPRINEITMAEDLQKGLNYPKIVCHYIRNQEIKIGIELYLDRHKADILIMFSRKQTFLERMFEKSATREVVFQSSVPLLIFSK